MIPIIAHAIGAYIIAIFSTQETRSVSLVAASGLLFVAALCGANSIMASAGMYLVGIIVWELKDND